LKLNQLRTLLKSSKKSPISFHALIIPSSDAHGSEYLAECDKRMSYISHFTGSAGTAVVTLEKAALWTDGRYFLQAGKELDENWTLMKMGQKETPEINEWLNEVLPPDSIVGCNPSLYASGSWKSLAESLSSNGHSLEPTAVDFIDEIWADQPPKPETPLRIVDTLEVAGVTTSQKIEEVREQMQQKKADWLVVTALDDVAYLFNMRASDIQYNPVFFSYAVVGLTSLHLFMKPSRMQIHEIKEKLHMTTLHKYEEIFDFLKNICSNNKTWFGRNSSHKIISCVNAKNSIVTTDNPVAEMKAVKNQTEIDAMKRCNITDAVALCRFFRWLEQEVPKGNVTECSASDKVLEYRKEGHQFVTPSFGTISSSGPTGSIIHYKPNRDDDRPVKAAQIYLVDSGGQYISGTTDTTRTMHFTQPTSYEKECFTRVLKGHIQVARSVFPTGTKGYMLDTLARSSLWRAGLDFRHGVGHGVGCNLNVHEGPIGIYIGNSPRITKVAENVDVKPGMFITNEPGYYEDGKFGIRIENLLLCVPVETKYNFGGKQFLGFETIALVPIQQKMIEKSLLNKEEIEWVNKYHTTVKKVVGRELKKLNHMDTYEWLLKQTDPL